MERTVINSPKQLAIEMCTYLISKLRTPLQCSIQKLFIEQGVGGGGGRGTKRTLPRLLCNAECSLELMLMLAGANEDEALPIFAFYSMAARHSTQKHFYN